MIVREEDSDSVVTRKVMARVLLGMTSLGMSEMVIGIEEAYEADSLLSPVTEGFYKYDLRRPSTLIVLGNHPNAVAAATNSFVRLGVRVIDPAQVEGLLAKHPIPSVYTVEFEAEVRTVGKTLGVEQAVFVRTAPHTVSLQGVSVETGEILWFGKAQSLGEGDVHSPEREVARLTDWAFDRIWCPSDERDNMNDCSLPTHTEHTIPKVPKRGAK